MTEDEAKTKWCPFTRVGFADHGGTNNRHDGGLNCIASACMAWRWNGYMGAEGKWVRKAPDGEKWNGANGDGYCGLAGHPQ